MSALSPGLVAAFSEDRFTLFLATKIVLPSATLRLLDSSGVVAFGGDTYTGRDSDFGVLTTVDNISDGIGDTSPAMTIGIIPPSDTAAATLAGAAMQGSVVSVFVGAIDPVTGLSRGDPYLAFLGEIDVPTIRAGAQGRVVEYEVVSVAERLFAEDEGAKLSDAFHQSIWPGETAFFDVTGIEQTLYWGQEPPKATIAVGPSSYGGRLGEAMYRNMQ